MTKVMNEIYGVHAKVYISYGGSLEELGKKLSKALNLSNVWYDNDEDEPYDSFGNADTLGFLVTFRKSRDSKWPDYNYLFNVYTSDLVMETFHNRMYDFSQWMARRTALEYDFVTMAENADKKTGQSFCWNKSTMKVENSVVMAKDV